MSYDSEQAAASRTPQAILTVGVPYCGNFYATTVAQEIIAATQDFTNGTVWTKTNCTVNGDTHDAPDNTATADTLTFTAVGGNAKSLQGPVGCASKALTGSVWLRSTSGTGTLTLELIDNADTEGGLAVVNLTEDWQRFSLHYLFSGAASGGAVLRIKRDTTDLGACVAWGANITINPGATNKIVLFPYTTTLLASTCQATDQGDGGRCYYTAPTCQNLANFNAGNWYEPAPGPRGVREYKFCMSGSPLPVKGGAIAPTLEGFDQAAQEIDPRRGITKAEKVSYRLGDEPEPGVWDLEKQGLGALVNTARGAGTFWRRFLAIHKNYSNPRGYARLKVGYVADGLTEDDYRTRLSGPMLDVSLDYRGRVVVRASDALENLKRKVPTKISTSNVVEAALSAGGTTLYLTDVYEVDEPPADGSYKVTLQIDSEKVNVTARSLAGGYCTIERGRWGTTAAPHAAGAEITASVEFGTEQTNPSLPVLGKNPVDCAIEVLRRGGLEPSGINVATLEDERDTWLPSTINPANGTQSGALFRRSLTEPTALEKLLFGDSEICDSALMWIWQDEDQRVTGKVFAPIRPAEQAVELTDEANFIADTVEVTDDSDARLTRVVYGYDLDPAERGDQLGDYLKQQARILSDEESPGYYGSQRAKIIKSQWLSALDTGTAAAVAARILNRFRAGARIVTAQLEVKDDDNVRLGTFVRVTTSLLQTIDGVDDPGRIMQVTRKQHMDLDSGRIKLSLVDTGLFGRFWFWSSASDALPEYDSASADERLYAFWADSDGRVGTAFDPPYRWW